MLSSSAGTHPYSGVEIFDCTSPSAIVKITNIDSGTGIDRARFGMLANILPDIVLLGGGESTTSTRSPMVTAYNVSRLQSESDLTPPFGATFVDYLPLEMGAGWGLFAGGNKNDRCVSFDFSKFLFHPLSLYHI